MENCSEECKELTVDDIYKALMELRQEKLSSVSADASLMAEYFRYKETGKVYGQNK